MVEDVVIVDFQGPVRERIGPRQCWVDASEFCPRVASFNCAHDNTDFTSHASKRTRAERYAPFGTKDIVATAEHRRVFR